MTTNNDINLALPVTVANGGTSGTSFTAYSVLCGGTTSSNPLQNVSGVGTSGQYLFSNGTAALPTWKDAGTTGYILQVKSTTTNTRTTTSSASYVDISGLSVSITPSSSTSKILIVGHVTMGSSAGYTYPIQLVRGVTNIDSGTGGTGSQFNATGAFFGNSAGDIGTIGYNYIDSPATTSSITYKLQTYASNTTTLIINGTSNNANNNWEGVGTSNITVMEIHG